MYDESEKYIPTIHWATTKDGFDSIVTLFNYYGYAFHNSNKEQTDADVILNFFNEDGTELQQYSATLETGRTLHIPVSKIHKNFSGIVTATMHPHGDMSRLSWKGEPLHKPIATSFFMLYEKEGGYKDFSHELFMAKKTSDAKIVEWATILYTDKLIKSGFVIMNNRLYNNSSKSGSLVTVQLYDMKCNTLSNIVNFQLNPGGSRLVMLDQVFPDMELDKLDCVTVVVRGNNIEQPMSFHVHSSGDFNIHHF